MMRTPDLLSIHKHLGLTFTGKGTANPPGRHALTMSDAKGFSFDIMNPSNEAELVLPSLPDKSSRTFEEAAATSTGFSGVCWPGFKSMGTFPPSESAHAFAALDPTLYAFYGQRMYVWMNELVNE